METNDRTNHSQEVTGTNHSNEVTGTNHSKKVAVSLRGLTTGYVTPKGRVEIQKDLNIDLFAGEFVCLLGRNGAGKTTLLRTLAGFLAPISGAVLIGGRQVGGVPQAELAKMVSVVLTERPSVSSMTVEQLVALGRSPHTGFWGRLADSDRRAVEEALDLTGVSRFKNRLVDTLSDGERQKTMIVKSLAQSTPIILLDEPTAFLDYPSKAEMMRLLKRLAHEQGKVIFLSTHDVNMALALADKLWLADRDLGIQAGTPRALADNGLLEKYLASPDLTFDPHLPSFQIK